MPFQDALAVKISLICSRGYGVMWVLSSRGLVIPKFSAPPTAKLCVKPRKVSEVQERARGLLSPCQAWWGSDFPAAGAAKSIEFFACLFVCLSFRHAFEHQRLCALFRHEGVGVQKRF